ncbi:isochorismate synthase, partial [Listeria monocytogenes]|nr:isochorismate synthase [Listeria monocytogenes]
MNSKSTSNYEAAIAAGKTYLSEYQPIERCDLLALYAAAQEYRGERYFWRTPDETTSIVGLGWLATFSQPKLADFSEVRSLLKQAHYQPEAPFQAQLVGGFAFDEQAEVSQDWAELGAGLFALPEILVSKTGDQCGVVYTVAASSEEQRQQKVAALQE